VIHRGQVRHQGPVAHRVGCLHVQIDAQARLFAGQQGKSQLEHLAVELLVRLGVPHVDQPLAGGLVSELAEVVDGNGIVGVRWWRDLLCSIGQKLHPQHRMPQRQRGRGPHQASVINCVAVEFDVQMPGHAAQRLTVVAAHPHGVLHGRKRKSAVGSGDRRRHRTIWL
jgi:hypothetical protein